MDVGGGHSTHKLLHVHKMATSSANMLYFPG